MGSLVYIEVASVRFWIKLVPGQWRWSSTCRDDHGGCHSGISSRLL